MILEILVICALTDVEPFYDCNEKWTIYLHEYDAINACMKHDFRSKACAVWEPPAIHINAYTPDTWKDKCGDVLLIHELNHLKYRDGNYCH